MAKDEKTVTYPGRIEVLTDEKNGEVVAVEAVATDPRGVQVARMRLALMREDKGHKDSEKTAGEKK